MLVVCNYRDSDSDRTHPFAEMLADLRTEPRVERLALPGLDPGGVLEMLTHASGHPIDAQTTELAQLLWSETDGNPFFVQEILRNLVESGRLVRARRHVVRANRRSPSWAFPKECVRSSVAV